MKTLMLKSIRKSRYYKILLWVILILITLLATFQGTKAVTDPKWLMTDDFVEYWAAGRLNVQGLNPYDPEQLLPLQLHAGRNFGVPVMMWNPPCMLTLVMPFGLISYPLSRTIWLFTFILVIIFCASTLWRLYGGSSKNQYISWVIGLTFVPVLDAIKTGQTGPLLLLGVVGFLYFIKRRNDLLAGLFISLLIVKPHILLLFGLAVLLWTLHQRRWSVILGVIVSLALGTLIAWVINPHVIQQYIHAIKNYPPDDWATPTIGGILRFIFGTEIFWLQFVAPILGWGWLIYYLKKYMSSWDWLERAPLLILVSTLTAAYGWSSDQSVALVAILQIAVIIFSEQTSSKTILISIIYVMIDALVLGMRVNQIFIWWLAPSLLIWYLLTGRLLKHRKQDANRVFFY